jgi:hypothetical protein
MGVAVQGPLVTQEAELPELAAMRIQEARTAGTLPASTHTM